MWTILGTAVGGYLVVCGAARLGYRTVLYPAPSDVRQPTLSGANVLTIEGADEATVHGLYSPAPDGAATVVYFHGNGEQMADVVPFARALRDHGLGVLVIEYPGYGLSSHAAPSEESLYAAAEVALSHARDELGVEVQQTVLMGHSLGTGVATEMARRGHGGRLVLVSPFTSMVAMAQRAAPILPMRWIIGDRYDNEAKAAEVEADVLIFHGDRDALIPVEMSVTLAELFSDARLTVVPDAGHNDVFAGGRGEELLGDVAEFCRTNR